MRLPFKGRTARCRAAVANAPGHRRGVQYLVQIALTPLAAARADLAEFGFEVVVHASWHHLGTDHDKPREQTWRPERHEKIGAIALQQNQQLAGGWRHAPVQGAMLGAKNRCAEKHLRAIHRRWRHCFILPYAALPLLVVFPTLIYALWPWGRPSERWRPHRFEVRNIRSHT